MIFQVMQAKYRSRFLQLADVFLASSLVPAYTIAAFIKRFARLGLTASPAGAPPNKDITESLQAPCDPHCWRVWKLVMMLIGIHHC